MKTLFSFVVLFLFLIGNYSVAQCDNLCFADAGSDKASCCGGLTIGGVTCQNNSPDPACPGSQVSFSWSPSTGLSCTTCCNPTANPASTTTYTLTVTFTCGVSGGSAGCCCDGCSGTTCADVGSPNECNGTQQRTDQVVFTRVTPNCCRLIYPEQLPEISNDKIKVYPIPNEGIFSIGFSENIPSPSINVFDASGKLVFNQYNFSEKTIQVNISENPKGVYFLQVKSNEDVLTFRKLIVQ